MTIEQVLNCKKYTNILDKLSKSFGEHMEDDLKQELILKTMEIVEKYPLDDNYLSYLNTSLVRHLTLLKNTTYKYLDIEDEIETEKALELTDEPFMEFYFREDNISKAKELLSKAQFEVFKLYIQGYNFSEIGTITHSSRANAHKLYLLCRKKLEEKYI